MRKIIVVFTALALAACGGGGGDPDEPLLAHERCAAASVAEANAFIAEGAECKAWAVDGVLVDGAPYPDFLIGGWK